MVLKARVHAGRLTLDEPTELPEGTEVPLLALDPGDWLNAADREALHAALVQSEAEFQSGRVRELADVLREIRSA